MGLLDFFRSKLPARANKKNVWASVGIYCNNDTGFLIVPYRENRKLGSVAAEPVIKLNYDVCLEDLGKGIISSIIEASKTRLIAFEPVIEKASGIKSNTKFSKVYRCIFLAKTPQEYKIQENIRDPKYGGYSVPPDDENAVRLPLDAVARELGQAIRDCLAVKHDEPTDDWMEFQLFDGRIMRFEMPPDDYYNIGDAHTDAHKVFKYVEKDDVYIGFFYGTNYDPLNYTTVKKIWEQRYGSFKTFEFSKLATGLFSFVAKAKGEDSVIRALFFIDNGVWNEFLLHIDTSGLTENEIEDIFADFEIMARSCVLSKLPSDEKSNIQRGLIK